MQIKKDYPLKELNTFKIEADADYFIEIQEEGQLKKVRKFIQKPIPVFILGGGSNILIKNDLEGLVLKNNITGIEKVKENDSYVDLKVKSGENWHDFVKYTVGKNWGGIENLALIPGSVGGAIIQNAGAYGAEIKDVLQSVSGVNLETTKRFKFTNEECEFGYRDSIFKKEKNKYLFITEAVFRLNKKPKINLSYESLKKEMEKRGLKNPTIKDVFEAVCDIRKRKLPDWQQTPTAGSFFKNPIVTKPKLEKLQEKWSDIPHFPYQDSYKLSAGWLIEQIEKEVNSCEGVDTYKNHSLTVVNKKRAAGENVYDFTQKLRRKVKEKFDIELQREVKIWET